MRKKRKRDMPNIDDAYVLPSVEAPERCPVIGGRLCAGKACVHFHAQGKNGRCTHERIIGLASELTDFEKEIPF